ncbi:MAG TPA: histidinol dehydrogenase, partial [Burkholderiales bacterium]|nr:histidinol dehydrogenase [Burkholderiales bacterium]
MIKLRRLSTADRSFDRKFKSLAAFDTALDTRVDKAVAKILAELRSRGDEALLKYTRRFDKLKVKTARELELPQQRLKQALRALSQAQCDALQQAAERIRSYHVKQIAQSWSYRDADGTLLGQQVTPLERVGMYVPGGKAAYPSTVLMNAIPAKLAGVPELIMAVPTPNGEQNDLVLASAAICGVNRVYTIGGAQAIGALAYGTKTIPQVDKIVGPGSAYVAAAKRRVFGLVGLDMIAGPSEILVICDGRTDPDWVAMDLFSQSEHDEMAQAILLSPDAKFLDAVAASVKRLLPSLSRKKVIHASLKKRGALIEVKDLEQAC